jgi:branched-chain amino acid transport system substrate-binding protein
MKKRRFLSAAILAAVCVAVSVALAACGGGGSSSGSSSSAAPAETGSAPSSGESSGGETIKVGNISGDTGPAPLPQAHEGVEAYFDAINAKGGINGNQIELIHGDDESNPATSAQLARKMIEEEGVVGFAGDLTLVGCSVNRQLFEQAEVISVMVGSDPSCFAQKNVSPVNAGQTTDLIITGLFAIEQLGATKPCAWMTPSPNLESTYPLFLEQVEEKTGVKFVFAPVTLTEKSNLAGYMISAKEKGCDAIITNGTQAQTTPIIEARDQQGLEDVPIIFQGSQYEESAAKAAGDSKNIYAIAEMEPFTEESPILAEMKADLKAKNVELNSLSQFGWEAAKVFGDTVAGIKGPVTREAVTKAFRELTSLDTEGMTGTPYSFGPGNSHNPNRSGKIVEIKNGKWTVVTPKWITLEESMVTVPPDLIEG